MFKKIALGALIFLLPGCGSETIGSYPDLAKGDPGPAGPAGTPGADSWPFTKVTPATMNRYGWQFASINTGKFEIRSGGYSVQYPARFNDLDAASVWLASGLGDGPGQGGKAYLGFNGLNYQPLVNFDGIEWVTSVVEPTPNFLATGSGYWNMYVALDEPGSVYENLVIDPAYFPDSNFPKAQPRVWQAWKATRATLVRCRYQKMKVGPGAADVCVKDAPYTLGTFIDNNPGAVLMPPRCSEIPYAHPDGSACNPTSAVINPNAPALSFMVGQSSGGAWVGAETQVNGFRVCQQGAYCETFIFRAR